MNQKIKKILKELEALDWGDVEKVHFCTQKVLKKIFTDRSILRLFIDNAIADKELVSLAEHYDFFDKLVLYVDKKDRFRIRLHLFSGETSNKNRPHCHRWAYSSVILHGGYQHFIYGTEAIVANTEIAKIKPILIKEEKVGSTYTINDDVFHSIAAESGTVTVIIRGPSVKDRFLIIDKKANKKWWEYGRESETLEEISKKSVSPESIKEIISKLEILF
jgi:hypothetical protein